MRRALLVFVCVGNPALAQHPAEVAEVRMCSVGTYMPRTYPPLQLKFQRWQIAGPDTTYVTVNPLWVRWRSMNPQIVQMTADGHARFMGPLGVAVISATSGGYTTLYSVGVIAKPGPLPANTQPMVPPPLCDPKRGIVAP